jgi:hypothetical protein
MRVPLGRRITLQFAAVLGLSTALGLSSTTANPIGVRFAKSDPGVDLRPGPLYEFHFINLRAPSSRRRLR